MTPIDDLELGQQLRALRVDPPDAGFEARLAERLASLEDEPPARAPSRPGIVRIGPWRRRPVQLLAATALLVAGAAAALEGSVVEWIRSRVAPGVAATDDAAPVAEPLRDRRPASPPTPDITPPEPPAKEPPAKEPPVNAPTAPEPLVLPPGPPAPSNVPQTPPSTPRLDVPRLGFERRGRGAALPPAGDRRPAALPPSVPRVQLEPRATGRPSAGDGRGIRPAPGPSGGVAPERSRELERVREIGRVRRERAGAGERPAVIERLRERRDRAGAERRELQNERARRERPQR